MADIDLNSLCYYKAETDQLLTDERVYTDTELAKKTDVIDVGSPGGLATLDPSGTHPAVEIPMADNPTTLDDTNVAKVMNPSNTNYLIENKAVLQTQVNIPEGVAGLNEFGFIDEAYLVPIDPPLLYEVDTYEQMLVLPNIRKYDSCGVDQDPDSSKNGQYIAEADNPVESQWRKIRIHYPVTSVNGMTDDVVITSIAESAQNKSDIQFLDADIEQNKTDIETNATDIVNLSARISTNETNIGTSSVRIDNNETNIASNNMYIQDHDTRIDSAEASIGTNQTDILSLQATAPLFTPVYTFNKVPLHVVADDTYEEVARLVQSYNAGMYEVKVSLGYGYSAVTRSAWFNISLDNGATWREISYEPKDTFNTMSLCIIEPVSYPNGSNGVIVQARKTNAGDTMVITNLNIIIERKI